MNINQKKSSSNSKTSESCATNKIHTSSVGSNINSSSKVSNKRCLSADGLSLLPSALRPRLLGGWSMLSIHFRGSKNCVGMILALFLSSFICPGMNSGNVSAASLTLTIPDSPVTLSLTPSASGGVTFAKSTGSNVSVKSDAYFGYTLTIKGKSSDNSLVNGSNKIPSISGSITESDFKTNTTYNNKWGYMPNKLNGSANSSFMAGPTSSTNTTIDKTSAANAGTANSYTLTIAAKVDSTVPSGKYSNNITISATANSTSYNITYNLQSGLGGPSPLTQSGNTTASSIKLSSTAPTKTNYTFEGWCTTTPTGQNTTAPSCGGTKYSAGANYPLSSSGNTVTLYAMWKQITRSYTINYHLESGSGGPSPNPQTGSTTATSVNISSTTPTKSGYSFEGWCTKAPTSNNTASPSCDGTTYKAGGSYTLSNTSNTLDLYAMWKQSTPSLTNFDCSSLSTDQTTNTAEGIQVRKVGSQCWMWKNYKSWMDWSSAITVCPSGWHLPSKSEFQILLSNFGYGSQLYNAGWNNQYYWSSTNCYGSDVCILNVESDSAGTDFYAGSYSLATTDSAYVRCLAN